MEKLTLPHNVTLCDRQRAVELIPDFRVKVDQVGSIKRGDWVRIMVEWQWQGKAPCEFITCLVSGVTPNAQGSLIKCRVLSQPDYTDKHSLRYGDDLVISPRHILIHDPMPTTAMDGKGNYYNLTPEQLEHNIATLLGGPAEPIAPTPGKQYWTRNGSIADVWTVLSDSHGDYFLGQAGGIRDIQWSTDGRHRQGNADLDIVKDPTASEVVGA